MGIIDDMDDFSEDRREPLPVVLPLDPATLTWLAAISGGSDAKAAEQIASMLRMIRVDDEAAHRKLN